MKTTASSIILLCAVAGLALAASVQAAPQRATAFAVKSVTDDGANIIQAGTPESSLRYWLGTPDVKVGDDVLVYFHFRAANEAAQEKDCTTLVLTVTEGKVSQIMLVNSPALTAIQKARTERPAGNPVFIAAR